MNPNKRDDVRKFMKELFDYASQDEGLLGDIDELTVEKIEGGLVRDIKIAKEVIARNRQ